MTGGGVQHLCYNYTYKNQYFKHVIVNYICNNFTDAITYDLFFFHLYYIIHIARIHLILRKKCYVDVRLVILKHLQ